MEHADSTIAPKVAELAGAKVPADRGLTGLGLLMQLSGSLFLAYGAYIAMLPILEGPGGGPRMEMFLIGVASAIRSAYHRSAGAGLLYGSPKGPLHKVRVYIGVAIAQSLAVFVLIRGEGLPDKLVYFFVFVLLAWPVTLALVLSTKRFKNLVELPKAEDMGFESAAVLMTIFGVLGSLTMGLGLISMFKSPYFSMQEVPSLLWMGVIAMLFARSFLHARAGLQGTMGVNADIASESASRYFNFGVMASVIAGAVLMLQMLMMQASMHFSLLITVAVAVYVLLIWPLALRNFFTDRNFSMLLDEQQFTRRAPDTGLTALGWLLLGLGVMNLSFSLGALLFLNGKIMGVDLMLLSKMSGGPGTHSIWWTIGVAGLQVAAGYELIRMSDRYRIITTAYGVVATLVTCYLWWPVIKNFGKAGTMDPLQSFQNHGQLFGSLTFAIAAVLLVNRHSAPDAQAKIKAEP